MYAPPRRMEIEYVENPDLGMWDIYTGDFLFCSVGSLEKAEIVGETIRGWMRQSVLRNRREVDAGVWDYGLDYAVGVFERELINEALTRTRGNVKRAADLLKVGRTTLHERIKRYGLDPREILA